MARKRSLGLQGMILLPVAAFFLTSVTVILSIVLMIASDNMTKLSSSLMRELNQHYLSVIQGSASSAEELASTSEELASQAQTMRDAVQVIKTGKLSEGS